MSTVLGQPIPLGGEGAVKYNTAQSLTTAQKEQAQKNMGVTWPCNPNLLDNWYFLNPVNQRGDTSFPNDAEYTIDRWRHYLGRSTTDFLTAEGVQLTTVSGVTQGLAQRLPKEQMPSGRVYTLSALLKIVSDTGSHETNANVALSYGTSRDSNTGSNFVPKTQPIGQWFVHTFTFTFPDAEGDVVNVRLRLSNGGDTTVVVSAMKLELGDTQTLAHQDAEGNWVLNEIPNYHTELLKCIQSTADPADTYANKVVATMEQGAGAHNSVYRGKSLGAAVTDAQWAAIKAGTFEDLYIGDYWTISGVNYRIAAFDYYYQTGDTACTTHHVTIVPDANMYTHAMNDSNVTTGAYIGSKMYKSGLSSAKTTINNAFGASHILNHRQYLQNATTNGYASAGSWYDSTVELMTEQNVYGCKVFGNCINGTGFPNNYTVDKSQYPLFAHRPDMISNRQWFWLRDVASAAYFCHVSYRGDAYGDNASSVYGVRPAFSIC